MRIRLLAPALGVAAGLGLLRAWSPGTVRPLLDDDGRPVPGSIAEKIRVPIRGRDHGMFLEGVDRKGPVLLFLHGGPGMPEYWLTRRYPTGLERSFVVAWWEQPGAGLSYAAGRPSHELTAEVFVDDTLAVARYLSERFGHDRIYVMAHSWGSYIGLQAVAADPSRFHAYVGVSQITHQIRSELESYTYMLQRFEELGDAAMVRRLRRAPVTLDAPLPRGYSAVRDRAMHTLGVGTTRDMRSVVTGLFLPSWRFPGYTVGEKVDLWRGKIAARRSALWDRMQATDLTRQVTRLEIPAYFLHGIHDRTASYAMARAYAGALDAPVKGFYTFERSAHSPMLEEPERTRAILTGDVLRGTNRLADPA